MEKNRIFDCACVCKGLAIGGVPLNFRRATAGLFKVDLANGSLVSPAQPLDSLCALTSLGGETYIAGTRDNDSQLHFFMPTSNTSVTISTERFVQLKQLNEFDHERFLCTMQLTKPSSVEFVHQLRGRSGDVLWEHQSESDTVVRYGDGRVAVYDNAGPRRKSTVDVFDANTGQRLEQVYVSSSIANLRYLVDDTFVYCSPNYEMVVRRHGAAKAIAEFRFPLDVPGWLNFSVDVQARILVACKSNNFRSPQTAVAMFSF